MDQKRAAFTELTRQFVRFALVGAAATALHYSIMFGLAELARVPKVLAADTGYVCAALFGYALNRRFTFEHKPAFWRGFATLLPLNLIGLLLNTLIVGGLIKLGVFYGFAQMAATGMILFYNFAAARLVVFRKRG